LVLLHLVDAVNCLLAVMSFERILDLLVFLLVVEFLQLLVTLYLALLSL